ncbi:hypothetical protein STAQ_29640 [Allostella sp. ATCC 35155]|nr:hypothetical protein STAQ_29640 [Stella sp. ATCC 35155]
MPPEVGPTGIGALLGAAILLVAASLGSPDPVAASPEELAEIAAYASLA